MICREQRERPCDGKCGCSVQQITCMNFQKPSTAALAQPKAAPLPPCVPHMYGHYIPYVSLIRHGCTEYSLMEHP